MGQRVRARAVRALGVSLAAALIVAACAVSSEPVPLPAAEPTTAPPAASTTVPLTGPGGYSFDRSDPAAGVANIMDAFATDEATATCIYDAWGDVANVAPEELTPELMSFEVCGTSIFELMTGDARFTGSDD